MTRKASIDIGTNSTRLLIVDVRPDGQLETLEHVERLTKLGAGAALNGELDEKAMDRVLSVLAEFKQKILAYEIGDIRVLATSATREAPNRAVFLDRIEKETSFRCRILSGEEEARLSFLGAISDYEQPENFLVCDVGGGSTEFIFACGKKIQLMKSLNFGSGRLTRQFLKSEPPREHEILSLRQFVRGNLAENFEKAKSLAEIVMVGGTAATLALMDLQWPFQDAEKTHHGRLFADGLQRIIDALFEKTVAERRALVGLHPERADVILGGALIFSEIMDYFNRDSLFISLRDLLFGIFLEQKVGL